MDSSLTQSRITNYKFSISTGGYHLKQWLRFRKKNIEEVESGNRRYFWSRHTIHPTFEGQAM